MIKKPLFWIIIIIILAILWFIFAGRNELNATTSSNASPSLSTNPVPLHLPGQQKKIVKRNLSKESIEQDTINAEEATLNVDNNHIMTQPKVSVADDSDDADDNNDIDDDDDATVDSSLPTDNISVSQIKNNSLDNRPVPSIKDEPQSSQSDYHQDSKSSSQDLQEPRDEEELPKPKQEQSPPIDEINKHPSPDMDSNENALPSKDMNSSEKRQRSASSQNDPGEFNH